LDEPHWRFGFVPTDALTRSASEGRQERARSTKNRPIRENWWADRGSRRYINDEDSLEAAIRYVRDGQDRPRDHEVRARN